MEDLGQDFASAGNRSNFLTKGGTFKSNFNVSNNPHKKTLMMSHASLEKKSQVNSHDQLLPNSSPSPSENRGDISEENEEIQAKYDYN